MAKIWCDNCLGVGTISMSNGGQRMCEMCTGAGYTDEAVVKVSEVLKKLDVECGLYGANSGVLNVVDWLCKKEQEVTL